MVWTLISNFILLITFLLLLEIWEFRTTSEDERMGRRQVFWEDLSPVLRREKVSRNSWGWDPLRLKNMDFGRISFPDELILDNDKISRSGERRIQFLSGWRERLGRMRQFQFPRERTRRVLPSDHHGWSNQYENVDSWKPINHVKPYETYYYEHPTEEYYRNLVNLPGFIKDYQSSYLETPEPPTQTYYDSNKRDPNYWQPEPGFVKLPETYDEKPNSPTNPPSYSEQVDENDQPHEGEEEGPSPEQSPYPHEDHENEELRNEKEEEPNPNNGKLKYTGCRIESEPEGQIQSQPNEENNLNEQKFPELRTVHIESIDDISLLALRANQTQSLKIRTDDEEFERLYPQIFGKFHLMLGNNTKNNQSSPLKPTNVNESSKNETPPVVMEKKFPTSNISTITTTTEDLETTTTSTTQSPIPSEPEDKKVSTNKTDGTQTIPLPTPLDMSASLSTEIHHQGSGSEDFFKSLLLDELILRLRAMENVNVKSNLVIGPFSQLRRNSQPREMTNSQQKQIIILKSGMRKLLKNLLPKLRRNI